MTDPAWIAATLFVSGVFTGAISLFAWERVWLWRRMSIDRFAVDFRRSLKRADPAMPILLVLSLIGSGGMATGADGADRDLLFVAIACQLAVLVGSLTLAEPINSRFRRVPEGVAPPNAEGLRDRWRRLHLARTALALIAFACIATAVGAGWSGG